MKNYPEVERLWKRLIVCSFYTPGPYEIEAQRLKASIELLGLKSYVLELPEDRYTEGSWKSVVRQKPWFIRNCVALSPGSPILFVDADAVLTQDPRDVMPTTWLDKDISSLPPLSVHSFGGRPCSGTVICTPGAFTIDALSRWENEDMNRESPRQPQSILSFVPQVDHGLGAEWCWIFDLSKNRFPSVRPEDVIVKHLQASREFRSKEDRGCHPPERLLLNRQEELKRMGERP